MINKLSVKVIIGMHNGAMLCKISFTMGEKEEKIIVYENSTLKSIAAELLLCLGESNAEEDIISETINLIKEKLIIKLTEERKDQHWETKIKEILQGSSKEKTLLKCPTSENLTYFGYAPMSCRNHEANLRYQKIKLIHHRLEHIDNQAELQSTSEAINPYFVKSSFKSEQRETIKHHFSSTILSDTKFTQPSFKETPSNHNKNAFKKKTVFDKLYGNAVNKNKKQKELQESVKKIQEKSIEKFSFTPKINNCSREIIQVKEELEELEFKKKSELQEFENVNLIKKLKENKNSLSYKQKSREKNSRILSKKSIEKIIPVFEKNEEIKEYKKETTSKQKTNRINYTIEYSPSNFESGFKKENMKAKCNFFHDSSSTIKMKTEPSVDIQEYKDELFYALSPKEIQNREMFLKPFDMNILANSKEEKPILPTKAGLAKNYIKSRKTENNENYEEKERFLNDKHLEKINYVFYTEKEKEKNVKIIESNACNKSICEKNKKQIKKEEENKINEKKEEYKARKEEVKINAGIEEKERDLKNCKENEEIKGDEMKDKKEVSDESRCSELYRKHKAIIFESMFIYLTCTPPQSLESFAQINKSTVRANKLELKSEHLAQHPYLPPTIRSILHPIYYEMHLMNITLDIEEFVWSLQRLHEGLQSLHKTALLAWGLQILPPYCFE